MTITDGETQEEVASGRLQWLRTGERYSGYKACRWYGFTPKGSFEVVLLGDKVTNKTWEEIEAEERQNYLDRQIKEKEAEMERLKKEMDHLKGVTGTT